MNVEPFALDLASPLSTAAGTIQRRAGVLVRLTVDGVEGVGEATPLAPWTESLPDCRAALDAAPDDVRGATESLDPDRTPAAAHAVQQARLDAEATAAGVSLAERLLAESGDPAGTAASSVPVNATVGDHDAETTAERATTAVDRGFQAVKAKVGARPPEEDARRLGAVRDAVGQDVELRADANGAWGDVERARHALGLLADHDLAYVEQPLPADDLAGLDAVRDAGVDVAADESVAAHPLADVLAVSDVVVLKPMGLGGPGRAAGAARRALSADVRAVVTTTVDGAYARTAAVHVAATLPDPPACGLATASRLAEDLAPDPAPVEGGAVRVPGGPGTMGGGA